MVRRRRQPTAKQTNELLREATAILESRARGNTRPRPGLVRISQLAHANWRDLEQLAKIRAFDASWEGATSYLASAIRAQTGSPSALLALQRNALRPLELRMLADCTLPPATPSELVAVICIEVNSPRLLKSEGGQGPLAN
jgi:hypothetical protein